ncbi:heterodisulfide reductase-related iron-sulfur binding cluster [Rhabdothermincola sp.]|uniref:heterodisulfide reductase-related iron-sulfur binding cluster n=1 Tax=Rhabdothermincola sp. TaxID=2820405 RepID=UPI002FE04314
MTTTYDPFHPKYFDEADLREELVRVFDLCHGCRLCFKFCTSFPTLFELIDRHDDQDAAKLTAAEQDQVVDECFQCKLCYINCPYIPGQSDWNLDFPRLMMRAEQVKVRNRRLSVKERLQNQALARTDLVGKVNTALAPIANRAIGSTGTLTRRLMEKTVGIAAQRVLPPYARQRFSTWFARRGAPEPATVGRDQGRVALFATCLVEYQSPQIGKDLVRVYERNGISCDLPAGQVCCGAPWLHSGDVDRFVAQGRKNVEVLADAVRQGHHIVVPQPTCGYVLKHDYVDYIGGPDAELVAANTYDAAEYLMKVHADEGTALDTEFPGEIPDALTYHAPCHLRAQNIGLKSRDLMALTGARITVVAECSAIDGTWGYREQHYEDSRKVARKMAAAITKAGNDVVAGDCHLANGGILQETGTRPVHPISIVARAYGIPEEDRRP